MAFNTRITLLRPKAGRDAAGQPAKGYDEAGQVWSDWRAPSGLATLAADARTSVTKASVRVRRGVVVAEGWGVRHPDGTVYEVLAVPHNEADRINKDLVCEAVK
jgi:SPP1 family predicted phage head-tail adaptor